MLKPTCATKCSILHIYPQFHSQDIQHFTLTLAVLPGVAVPHMKRGTAAERHYRTWATVLPRLKWPLGVRGYLYPSSSSPMSLFLLLLISACLNKKGALSLPPLLTSSPQANPLISPSILEGKRSKTRLESSSIDSPTQKSTWFMFWPAVVLLLLELGS